MSNGKLKILLLYHANIEIEDFIQKFTKKRFSSNYKSTVGVDILNKEVEYEPGKKIQLSIWDIVGQQRFKFIRDTFCAGTAGFIFIFDLKKPETFEFIKERILDINQSTKNKINFIIIGINEDCIHKFDQNIHRTNIKEFSEKHDCIFFEASVDNVDNIEEILIEFTRRIMYSRK